MKKHFAGLVFLFLFFLCVNATFITDDNGTLNDADEQKFVPMYSYRRCQFKMPEYMNGIGPKETDEYQQLMQNNLNASKLALFEKAKQWTSEHINGVSKMHYACLISLQWSEKTCQHFWTNESNF